MIQCNHGEGNNTKTKKEKRKTKMKMSEKMREITNKVIKEKEAKEMERLNELYNSILSNIEYEANKGNSSAVIKNQGFDNDKIIEMLENDGFTVSRTKCCDNFVKW